MTLQTAPPPPTRPKFGPWADLPRDHWTEAQLREHDDAMAAYAQAMECWQQWLLTFAASAGLR